MTDYVRAVVQTAKSLWDLLPPWRSREAGSSQNQTQSSSSVTLANGLLQYNNNGIYSVSRKRKSEYPDCYIITDSDFECAPSPKYQRIIQTMSKQKQRQTGKPVSNGRSGPSNAAPPNFSSTQRSNLLQGGGVYWGPNIGNAAKPYGIRATLHAVESRNTRCSLASNVAKSRLCHKEIEELMDRWDSDMSVSTPLAPSSSTFSKKSTPATTSMAPPTASSSKGNATTNRTPALQMPKTSKHMFSLAHTPRPKHFIPSFRTSIVSRGSKPEVVDLENEEEDDVVILDSQPKIFTSSPAVNARPLSRRTFPTRLSSIKSSGSISTPSQSLTSSLLLEEDEETKPQEDDDLMIISEKIITPKLHRINSLELETRSSRYREQSWLNDSLGSFHDNRKFREDRIDFETKKLAILKNQSLLNNDIEARIRNNLTLTDIIVLEEPEEKLPEFTRDMEDMNEGWLRGRTDAVLVVTASNIQITKGDIKTLGPGQWLNDNIINSYMDLISARAKSNTSLPKVHVFSTFFYPKYLNEGHSRILKRWTRKVDIFDVDLLIFPIHLGIHWCLAVADHRSKTLRYFDSLFGQSKRALEALLEYMSSEHLERKQAKFDTSKWKLVMETGIPGQENGSDCGVFTCQFAEYLSRDAKLTFSQKNMPYFRQRMIYETVKQEILIR